MGNYTLQTICHHFRRIREECTTPKKQIVYERASSEKLARQRLGLTLYYYTERRMRLMAASGGSIRGSGCELETARKTCSALSEHILSPFQSKATLVQCLLPATWALMR